MFSSGHDTCRLMESYYLPAFWPPLASEFPDSKTLLFREVIKPKAGHFNQLNK